MDYCNKCNTTPKAYFYNGECPRCIEHNWHSPIHRTHWRYATLLMDPRRFEQTILEYRLQFTGISRTISDQDQIIINRMESLLASFTV